MFSKESKGSKEKGWKGKETNTQLGMQESIQKWERIGAISTVSASLVSSGEQSTVTFSFARSATT